MRIVADLHTHTIASGHAYSTVNELAGAAVRRGLAALALTDHGPALPGGPHPYHFCAMRFVPETISGVRILTGVEANIIGRDGSIDLLDETLAKLDFVMAGLLEAGGLDGKGIPANTEAVLAAMHNPRIRAISHPGNPAFPLDYEAVVAAAVATGTALEINNSSLSMSRAGSRPNCDTLARLIARENALVVVGSDAHIAQGVGVFDDAIALLTAAGVAEEQVVNTSLDRLLAFLGLSLAGC